MSELIRKDPIVKALREWADSEDCVPIAVGVRTAARMVESAPAVVTENSLESTGFIPAVLAEMRQESNTWLADGVYEAVCEVGFKVDKEELMKLLRGDRQSYDKGYADGKRDAVKHGHWITEDDGFWCSKCHAYANRARLDYCPDCGAKMDEEVSE